MSEELKPCPFCGDKKPVIYQSGGYWKIKCVNGCSLAISGYNSKQGASDAWNRRPSGEDALHTQIAQLQAGYLWKHENYVTAVHERDAARAELAHVKENLAIVNDALIDAQNSHAALFDEVGRLRDGQAKLREEADKDYISMRRFQSLYMVTDHELRELRNVQEHVRRLVNLLDALRMDSGVHRIMTDPEMELYKTVVEDARKAVAGLKVEV